MVTRGVRRRTRTSRWVGAVALWCCQSLQGLPNLLGRLSYRTPALCTLAPCVRAGVAPAATLGGSLVVPDPACICLPVCLNPS